MKYNEKSFNSAVRDYKAKIKSAKGKNFIIIFGISNKKAFYSMARLPRAWHELEADVAA